MINKSLIIIVFMVSFTSFTVNASCLRCLRQGFVEFKYKPAPPGHYVDLSCRAEDRYNPDLATGDDDALHYPDLDIDL